MTCLILGFVMSSHQGIPARATVLDAKLDGKPYGTVAYTRGIVPGKGREKSVTFEVDPSVGKYKVTEKRLYSSDGTPLQFTFAYSEGEKKIEGVATFQGMTATVVFDYGDERETSESVLAEEKASIIDPTQAWFYGSAPKVGAVANFWEFNVQTSTWSERTVTYEGVAKIKFGGQNVDAHRVTVGKNTVLYLDEWGIPYRTTQETSYGKIEAVRRGGGD